MNKDVDLGGTISRSRSDSSDVIRWRGLRSFDFPRYWISFLKVWMMYLPVGQHR